MKSQPKCGPLGPNFDGFCGNNTTIGLSANLLSNIQTLINENLDISQTYINLNKRLSTFINVYCCKGGFFYKFSTPLIPFEGVSGTGGPIQVWALNEYLRHISTLVNVYQRLLLQRLIPGMSSLPYEERLRRLKIPSLSFRRQKVN